MSAILGWISLILFALLFLMVWRWQYFSGYKGKRINLPSYVIHLLMSDTIREDHKRKFEDWIRRSEARDATTLVVGAYRVIENIANQVDVPSATDMIWKYKAGEWQGEREAGSH